MYKDICSPLPDIDACLRRIGLQRGDVSLDLAGLERLLGAHLAHIPFENLDAYAEGKTPDLNVPALFDKMILHRRGGWCFELNGLLHALLQALGFESYGVGVRVVVSPNPYPPISHRGELVILDGKKYYCDVGFGTVSIPQPVPLEGGETASGIHIEPCGSAYRLYRRTEAGPQCLLQFCDHEFLPQDYIPANFYNAQNEDLPFRKRLSVSIQDGELRRQLVGFTMKEYRSGELVRSVTAGDNAQLSQLLEEAFGIEYIFQN